MMTGPSNNLLPHNENKKFDKFFIIEHQPNMLTYDSIKKTILIVCEGCLHPALDSHGEVADLAISFLSLGNRGSRISLGKFENSSQSALTHVQLVPDGLQRHLSLPHFDGVPLLLFAECCPCHGGMVLNCIAHSGCG